VLGCFSARSGPRTGVGTETGDLTLATAQVEKYCGRMKLHQGQIWKCGEQYVRIVHLERLEVGYKTFKTLKRNTGEHQHTSKKDFCRMLKGATLLTGSPELPQKPPSGL
jgi:hypothetical protein